LPPPEEILNLSACAVSGFMALPARPRTRRIVFLDGQQTLEALFAPALRQIITRALWHAHLAYYTVWIPDTAYLFLFE
jgi:hypothetical protein